MKLINKSTRNYIAFNTLLEAGKTLEVKDTKTANILLTQPGVEEYVDKEDVAKLKEEIKQLKAEKQPELELVQEDEKQEKPKKTRTKK